MPPIIFDKLRFKAYRVFTSTDKTGKTFIAGFCEMEMPNSFIVGDSFIPE